MPKPDESWLLHQHGIVREMLTHEDRLIAIRVGWMMAAHGLLISAFAFSKDPSLFRCAIAAVGLMSSVFVLRGVLAAQGAIADLITWWDALEKDQPHDLVPDVIGQRKKTMLGQASSSPVALTVLFIVFWGVMLASDLFALLAEPESALQFLKFWG